MSAELFESATPERIAAAMRDGERCLRANGHDFPPELNTIGREGETREVVRPWHSPRNPDLNAWVSRYQWTAKRLRCDKRLIDYLRGGWIWLGEKNVGCWLLIYCGAQKREFKPTRSIVILDGDTIKFQSTTQADLYFFSEPATADSFMVASQVDGYPGTEAFDDWLAYERDANAIALLLAEGKEI